jgi:hypothetical protein
MNTAGGPAQSGCALRANGSGRRAPVPGWALYARERRRAATASTPNPSASMP